MTNFYFRKIPYSLIEEKNTVYILGKIVDNDVILYIVVKSRVTDSLEIIGSTPPHPITCKNWRIGFKPSFVEKVKNILNIKY